MHPSRNPCALAVMEELRTAGYSPAWEPRGKHAAAVWEHAGEARHYILPSTPSDNRAAQNARADVRRMIRADAPATAEVIPFIPRIVATDGAAVANSRDVAEAFGKEHRHVLRDIDNLLKNIDCPNLGSVFFTERYAPDGQGIDRRTFDMTRDGFSLLAMGFTGKAALEFKLRFLEAFNTMERALSRAVVPGADTAALEAVKGDLAALTDLVLEMKPAPVKGRGRYIRPSVLRRLRRAI